MLVLWIRLGPAPVSNAVLASIGTTPLRPTKAESFQPFFAKIPHDQSYFP